MPRLAQVSEPSQGFGGIRFTTLAKVRKPTQGFGGIISSAILIRNVVANLASCSIRCRVLKKKFRQGEAPCTPERIKKDQIIESFK